MRGSIPKGFRPKAQGCEERATLGVRRRSSFNPERVVASTFRLKAQQGGATTLSGLSGSLGPFPRVARSSQPWAGGHNPFGIEDTSKVHSGLAHSKTWRSNSLFIGKRAVGEASSAALRVSGMFLPFMALCSLGFKAPRCQVALRQRSFVYRPRSPAVLASVLTFHVSRPALLRHLHATEAKGVAGTVRGRRVAVTMRTARVA